MYSPPPPSKKGTACVMHNIALKSFCFIKEVFSYADLDTYMGFKFLIGYLKLTSTESLIASLPTHSDFNQNSPFTMDLFLKVQLAPPAFVVEL